MTKKSLIDCERDSLERLGKYQLPNVFRKIGFALFGITFAALFINKFLIDSLEITVFIKYGMLIGLLMVSISKEKIEDELVTKLRMQSYAFAFIGGVFFSLVLPFVDYLFDFILDQGEPMFNALGDWSILWFLLSVQVFYFELLKRMHK